MEFHVGMLIFITCMIALALLIYYCQEYRTPKYSFTDNQRDISSIALAIGVPGFQPSDGRRTPYPPGFIPPDGRRTSYPLGFIPTHMPPLSASTRAAFGEDGNPSAPPQYSTNDLPPYPTKLPPREYVRDLVLPDYMSDDSSTSSEQIYYPPKTAAYNVAKRMSMSANAARRMSAAAYNKEKPSMTADVAAFLIAKKMSKNFLQRKAANALVQPQDSQNKPKQDTPISENTDTLSDPPSYKLENEKVLKSTSPQSSATESARSSINRIIDEESSKRRSASPCLPASVVAFHLKNRNSRSASPYTALKNDSCAKEETVKSPSPPKRAKKLPIKPAENDPLSCRREHISPPQSENDCVPKRSESLPLPQRSNKSVAAKRSESLPLKENNSDRLPLTSSEIAYRSHSPTPLHTVEEEED